MLDFRRGGNAGRHRLPAYANHITSEGTERRVYKTCSKRKLLTSYEFKTGSAHVRPWRWTNFKNELLFPESDSVESAAACGGARILSEPVGTATAVRTPFVDYPVRPNSHRLE